MNVSEETNAVLKEYRQNRYQILVKQGTILNDAMQEALIEHGVLHHKGEYYLEDILKIIIDLLPHGDCFLRMHYMPDKTANITLFDGNPKGSEEKRAQDCGFVNAAGKFLIQAIERGFLKSNWQHLAKLGFSTSEYDIRSNLLLERNWIKSTFYRMSPKKNGFFQKLFKKISIIL